MPTPFTGRVWRDRRGQLGGPDDPLAGLAGHPDAARPRDDPALEDGARATRGRRCSSGARRARSRRATTRRSPPGTGWRSGPSPTRAGSSGSRATRTRPSARPTAILGRPARRRRRPRPVVEGRPRERPGRPRGLHAPGRRPARPLRGDLRRALVRDGPRADGPRARPFRRSRPAGFFDTGRRPRAARRPAQGPAGQRGPVGERDGDARPAAAGGVDRRGPLSRCRGAGAAHGRAVPRALPDRVRPVARGARPRARPGRRGRDRRRPGRSGDAGAARRDDPRLPAAPGRGGQRRPGAPRSIPLLADRDRRSTAGRRPTSAAGSSAGCR